MSTVLLPYNMASEGAAALADRMSITRIRRENSRYRHRENNIVINWGCPDRPPHIPENAKVLNPFSAVKIASNKLDAVRLMDGNVRMPMFTTSQNEASDWIADGHAVVARTILNGHGGKGIVLVDEMHQLVRAPLYTIYVPKKSEYRVHVVNNNIIDVTRKVLREDYPNKQYVNWRVRNHDNGFIFTRMSKMRDQFGNPREEKDVCPTDVKIQALRAVSALRLNFGAVDVIWNEKHKRAYVLEVNTAPGIADTACERYAIALHNMIEYGERIRIDIPQIVEDKAINPAPRPIALDDDDDILDDDDDDILDDDEN